MSARKTKKEILEEAENLWFKSSKSDYDATPYDHFLAGFEAAYLALMPKSDDEYLKSSKQAYQKALMKTGNVQPPCTNEYVADGCEKF